MSESGKSVQRAVRQRRLSAALRENLKRRKAQAKAQARERDAASPEAEKSDAPHDSAGIGAEKPDRPLRSSFRTGEG